MKSSPLKITILTSGALFLAIWIPILLLVCDPIGWGTSGIITDEHGNPVEGAIVLGKWEGYGGLLNSHIMCFRLASATTDRNGYYEIPSYVDFHGLITGTLRLYVYAPGYVITEDTALGNKTLLKYRGSKEGLFENYERIRYLTQCINEHKPAKLSTHFRYRFIKMMHDELKPLAETKEEKDIVNYLAFDCVSSFFNDDGSKFERKDIPDILRDNP
ncbi:MAG TPA: hypothetical protein DIC36_05830 [Gammaproteobacteria bacterium]|nr:hypothetical protein [Gammaproteobacteria bacterium]